MDTPTCDVTKTQEKAHFQRLVMADHTRTSWHNITPLISLLLLLLLLLLLFLPLTPVSSLPSSILLLGVAILSLYSVHLLLMTAKEGGLCSVWLSVCRETLCLSVCLSVHRETFCLSVTVEKHSVCLSVEKHSVCLSVCRETTYWFCKCINMEYNANYYNYYYFLV